MAPPQHQKLAVLIDADNAQAAVVNELLAEVSRYGNASIKRAYGDWTTTKLRGWKDVLHTLAIQPVQQFSYTEGKNSTDSSLIIDAMDLLHAGNLDGICLVSSDSDFTRLATRTREAGLVVYGFGEKKTPRAFVAACDKFIYIDALRPGPEQTAVRPVESPDLLEPIIRAAVIAATTKNGWSPLSAIGSMLSKNSSPFDPRKYGFPKLGELVRKQNYLEVNQIVAGDGSPSGQLEVKLRKARG